MTNIIYWGIWAVLGVAMLLFYRATKRPVKNALIGMLTGGGGLIAMHFLGGGIGAALSLSFFNVLVALILGLPGIGLLTIMNFAL